MNNKNIAIITLIILNSISFSALFQDNNLTLYINKISQRTLLSIFIRQKKSSDISLIYFKGDENQVTIKNYVDILDLIKKNTSINPAAIILNLNSNLEECGERKSEFSATEKDQEDQKDIRKYWRSNKKLLTSINPSIKTKKLEIKIPNCWPTKKNRFDLVNISNIGLFNPPHRGYLDQYTYSKYYTVSGVEYKSIIYLASEFYQRDSYLTVEEKINNIFVSQEKKLLPYRFEEYCFDANKYKLYMNHNSCDSASKVIPASKNSIEKEIGGILIIGHRKRENFIFSQANYQANLIQNILSESVLSTVSDFSNYSLTSFFSLLSAYLVFVLFSKKNNYFRSILLSSLFSFGVLFLTFLVFIIYFKIVIDIFIYQLVNLWIIFCISLYINYSNQRTKWFNHKKHLLIAVQNLVLRTLSDIHEKPLQSLLKAKDNIEFAKLKNPNIYTNYPSLLVSLDELKFSGKYIRERFSRLNKQLDSLNSNLSRDDGESIDEFIIQCVNQSLDKDFHDEIDDILIALKNENLLKIDYYLDLNSIPEYSKDQSLLTQKIDILAFISEAIRNVIKHSQIPYGNASIVTIKLTRVMFNMNLFIENNGCNIQLHAKDKYSNLNTFGTQCNNNIANRLPNGIWSREFLPNGVVKVSLSWSLYN